jgi:hypothetical protein
MVLVTHGFRACGLHVMKSFKRMVILHCNGNRDLSGEVSLDRDQEVGRLGQVWSREIIDVLLVGFSREGFPR